jgi:hypothetical protein
MEDSIKDPVKRAALTPTYRLGCKRVRIYSIIYSIIYTEYTDIPSTRSTHAVACNVLVPPTLTSCVSDGLQVLLNDEFYDVMGSDHVALVPLGVAEVTETGIIDSEGHSHDVDAIVWATGRSPLEIDPCRRSRANQPHSTHAFPVLSSLCVQASTSRACMTGWVSTDRAASTGASSCVARRRYVAGRNL